MSLKVWLPLIENTNNQGISSLNTFSYNTLTQQTDGKLGKCYSGQGIYHLENDFLSNEWSLCAWVKSASWSQYNDIILCKNTSASDNCQFYFSIINGTTLNFAVNGGSGGLAFSYAFATNTWYHVAATYNGSEYALYINGEQKKKQTISTTAKTGMNNLGINCRSTNAAGTSQTGDGGKKLNDVRIYDHCLSTAEVREIAQGLVLHYKLDNTCAFTDLIARNVNVTAYNNHGNTNNPTTITYLSTHYYGDRIIQYSATPTENAISSIQNSLSSHGIYNWRQTFKANTKYVFWIYYKPISHPDTRCGGTASNIGGWTEIPPVEVGGGWYRVGQYRNGTVTSDKTDNIFVSYKTPSAQVGDTIIIQFAAPHLIEGMMEIPPYDYSSDIIEDSSGYNHNGICVDTITSSNSPRYNNCISCIGTTVDSSSNTIAGAQYFYCNMDMPATNAITIAWWNKIIKYGRGGIFETSNSVQTNTTKGADYNTTAFANWDTTFGVYNGSTRVNIFSNFARDGEWHHHAITFDGVNVKYYLDSVLKQTSALAGNLPAWKSFCIGLGKAGGVWRQIQQNVSDFRIYCTPLLDTDIKQLYNVGMKVDKSQNVHTFEFNESAGKTQFLKTGVIKSAQIADNLLFDNKAHIGKRSYENILPNDISIITTKSSNTKTGTLPSISAAAMQSLAGKTLRFTYDVKADGTRSSAENGQTAYNYVRYGIHGSFQYTNASGTTGTSYPFAGDLVYSGAAKRSTQTWTVPSGYQSYGALNFSIQAFDKPASTNNETWFIQNVRLEIIDTTSNGYVTGTQIIER